MWRKTWSYVLSHIHLNFLGLWPELYFQTELKLYPIKNNNKHGLLKKILWSWPQKQQHKNTQKKLFLENEFLEAGKTENKTRCSQRNALVLSFVSSDKLEKLFYNF